MASGDVIGTANELASALAAQFVTNADAGNDTANDLLIEELAAWRRKGNTGPTEESGAKALPYRLPGSYSPTVQADAAAHEDTSPSIELLRRVREGLIQLPMPGQQTGEPAADAPGPATEFPTLDVDEFEDMPLRHAVHLGPVERPEFPCLLAATLPGVAHALRETGPDREVHEFIDTTTGAAVRYVLIFTVRGHVKASVAECGSAGLFDRLVAACTAWEVAGRPDPATWVRQPR